MRRAILIAAVLSTACGVRYGVPAQRARDARFGYLAGDGEPPTKDEACSAWMGMIVARDADAISHVSFPETDPQTACYVPVQHEGDDRAYPLAAAPRGCAFPSPAARERMRALAAQLDEVAAGRARSSLFECGLPDEDVRLTAAHDARVLRALVAEADDTYPYAAIVVPGHGLSTQGASVLVPYRPREGAQCLSVDPREFDALGWMMPRTRRAASLLHGRVAPIAIVSGGAVHSRLVEAFAMLHLLSCPRDEEGRVPFAPIAPERVLLEPCADHTHTNLRNAARWLDAIGARAAYLITDDHIQSKYFQDESGFELLLGSIDQRSIRDFGYVIGSWRQASVGLAAGFWFTPYRFWAEPRDGLGSVTCVDSDH